MRRLQEGTCVNDFKTKLQITGLSHHHRRSSMQNWAAFLPLLLEKTVMGPEHKGVVHHLVLTRTELLSAYFYHPFHHKGCNYAHFSRQPQLPQSQVEVYLKLWRQRSKATLWSPRHQSIQGKPFFFADLPCLLLAS